MRDIEWIWQKGVKFRSLTFAQTYLKENYSSLGMTASEKLSFQNCDRFIYYLEYGEKYYKQANVAPLELQPILVFYGMIQLMKACLLVTDPLYPENSQVLAHGVSTRKRKKINYEFLDDEVKIQKHGLLPHFANKMFHVKHLSGQKYKMRQLLRQIPELASLFSVMGQKNELQFMKKVEDDCRVSYTLDKVVLDRYQLGFNSFISFLSTRSSNRFSNWEEDKDKVFLHLAKPLNPLACEPFLFDMNEDFYLATNKADVLAIPELIVHYLILYNLSMICRYETEWWGELFHHYSEKDYPFIVEFLFITKKKVPFLLLLYLEQQMKTKSI